VSTRFYFPSTGAAAISVTPSASWNKTAGAQAALTCVIAKIASAMANVANSENVATDYYQVLIQQYVSAPLNGTQAISGTWAAYMLGMEDNALANFSWTTGARVVSNDGLTVRGTLWALGGTSNEWNTSLRNGGSNYNSIITVNALDGDRIVFEFGFSSNDQVSVTNYTGTIRIGDNGSVDLPLNETDTDQTKNPWLQFDDVTLSFKSETPPPPSTRNIWRRCPSGRLSGDNLLRKN
jgi:hypothetical protein